MAKAIAVVVVIVLIAIVGYAVFPYAVGANVSSLRTGSSVYLYGRVTSQRVAFANISVFQLNTSSGAIYVEWGGSLPSTGSMVLVHGRVGDILGVKYVEADSVTPWPF